MPTADSTGYIVNMFEHVSEGSLHGEGSGAELGLWVGGSQVNIFE